jgi:hypothetical protein
VDEVGLLEPADWARAGVPLLEMRPAFVQNTDLLDVLGAGVIFSDSIRIPNPAHLSPQRVFRDSALVNLQALEEVFFVPESNVQMLSEEAIVRRLQDREIDFSGEVLLPQSLSSLEYISSAAPYDPGKPFYSSVLRDEDRWLFTVYVPTDGILLFGHEFRDDWRVRIQGRSYSFLKANGLIMGLAVGSGYHELEIYRAETEGLGGAMIVKRTGVLWFWCCWWMEDFGSLCGGANVFRKRNKAFFVIF